jgi:ferredoxin
MPKSEVLIEMPEFEKKYNLAMVDASKVASRVRPKQFLHIDESECILCEGCVDICPWKCIHYLSTEAIEDSINVESPDESPGFFVVDEEACTRCALCVDRCPTGVISLGKFAGSLADQAVENGVYTAPWDEDSGERSDRHGYIYGRLENNIMQKLSLRDRIKEARVNSGENFKGGKLWSSIFRPGSPFRKGYVDSPRNRSYVVMNNVLYHLHPVKVKRHGVRLSYTLCLGGLSFFLFIVLTITGIWLMFYFRPTELAYVDIQNLQTSIAFGSLVRNMHRWGAHLMVLVVFLHMSRVFYHGAYKAPREFNWVIGVILLLLTLLLSFTGYLLPWDQLAIWAVTVGGNMAGYTPVIGAQAKFGLFAGLEATTATLLRFYVLHVLFLPFIIVIFMAVHFWRVRKDGGISGPL